MNNKTKIILGAVTVSIAIIIFVGSLVVIKYFGEWWGLAFFIGMFGLQIYVLDYIMRKDYEDIKASRENCIFYFCDFWRIDYRVDGEWGTLDNIFRSESAAKRMADELATTLGTDNVKVLKRPEYVPEYNFSKYTDDVVYYIRKNGKQVDTKEN